MRVLNTFGTRTSMMNGLPMSRLPFRRLVRMPESDSNGSIFFRWIFLRFTAAADSDRTFLSLFRRHRQTLSNFLPWHILGSLPNRFRNCKRRGEWRILPSISLYNLTDLCQRRPLLVYVHHQQASFTNTFCSEIFSSPSVVGYLLENYVVWPCHITSREDSQE